MRQQAGHGHSVLQKSATNPFVAICILMSFQELATELVRKVFNAISADSQFVSPSSEESPLTLLRVCRRWKDIALTSPELWTSLDASATRFYPSYTAMVDLWLRRSRNRPLNLHLGLESTLTEQGFIPCVPDEHAASLLHIFLSHMARWRDVHFRWDAPELPPIFFTFPLQSLGMLQNFTFAANADIGPIIDRLNAMFIGSRLRNYHLISEFDHNVHVPPISLEWEYLTHLTMDTQIGLATFCLNRYLHARYFLESAFSMSNSDVVYA
jgi:hypothetical protein